MTFLVDIRYNVGSSYQATFDTVEEAKRERSKMRAYYKRLYPQLPVMALYGEMVEQKGKTRLVRG